MEAKWFTGKGDEVAAKAARHTGHLNGASTISIQFNSYEQESVNHIFNIQTKKEKKEREEMEGEKITLAEACKTGRMETRHGPHGVTQSLMAHTTLPQ